MTIDNKFLYDNDILTTPQKAVHLAKNLAGRVSRFGLYAAAGLSLLACDTNITNNYDGTPGSGNPTGACGNSPLVGKYLWDIAKCDKGSITPVDKNTCSTETGGAYAGVLYMEGNIIKSSKNQENGVQLVRDFDCQSEVKTSKQDSCGFFSCILENIPSAYITKKLTNDFPEGEVRLGDLLYIFTDEPWSNQDQCKESSYYQNLEKVGDICR